MNKIQELENEVKELFPDAITSIDEGASSTAAWWLDVRVDRKRFSIEWKPERGFGVSSDSPESTFGEGPDHVCESMEEALGQLLALIQVTA